MTAATSPRRLRGKLILAGALFYLVFLLIQTPVSWMISLVPESSPIQLRQASGSPWNGVARQVIWQVDSDRLELGKLSWRWIPGELLDGRIGLKFELDQAANRLTGHVMLGSNGISLKNVQGLADAVLLGFAARPMSLLQPQGSLAVNVPNLFLSDKRIHGDAQLEWLNARSGLVAAPLGNYRAALTSDPDGRRARVDILTLSGPLAMSGNGELQPGKNFQGSLRLTPPRGDDGKIYRPLLDFLGRADASGTWNLFLTPH